MYKIEVPFFISTSLFKKNKTKNIVIACVAYGMKIKGEGMLKIIANRRY